VISWGVDRLRTGSLSFVLLLAGACSDECQQESTGYAFDEPAPWGETPAEVFGHVQGPGSGTLTWAGPLIEGEIDPALAETVVTYEVTLDTSSVTGISDRPLGACGGELEIDATLSIVTADGALDESFPVVIVAGQGSNSVSTLVDLTGYEFAGTLELSAGWTKYEMRLGLFWDTHTMMGVMQTGDALDAQAPQDPDAKRGFYAVLSGG
jgi:hypothetical protein